MKSASAAITLFLASCGYVVTGKADTASLQLTDSTTRRVFDLRARRAIHREAAAAIMHNMTLATALDVVKKRQLAGPSVMGLIQQSVSHKTRVQRSDNSQKLSATSPVAEVRTRLGDLILESEKKKDLEEVKCSEYESRTSDIMEGIREDIASFGGEAAQAREEILRAQSMIEMLEQKLAGTRQARLEHHTQCGLDTDELAKQLRIVEADMKTMEQVIGMVGECSGTGFALIQCQHKRHRTAFVTLAHHARLRKKVAALKSKAARQMIQEHLQQVYNDSEPVEASADDFLQVNEDDDEEVDPNKKCSIRKSNSCPKIKDKFLQIGTGVESKRDELNEQKEAVRIECKSTQANFEAQIDNYAYKLKSEQTNLAKATKHEIDAQENQRLKSEEHQQMQKSFVKMMATCHVNINDFDTEICGLRKIRSELLKMKKEDYKIVRDCEVSDWSAQDCSATCGGGTQKLTRTVVVQPYQGAGCPPLEMERGCNDNECPADCELGDWSGWSACSAECGGGVMEQMRPVATAAAHGGEQCGETTQAEECNMQACDVDCVLSDWSAWTACSKACDTGSMQRRKGVAAPPVGAGHCEQSESPTRTELTRCNEQTCEKNLQCDSKLDIILLMDGSASLGEEGWKATKEAVAAFLGALHGGDDFVKVGVLLFSGPKTWTDYYACTGTSSSSVDLRAQCGLEWVSHLTTDIAPVVTAVNALTFPAASTLTSMALALTHAEMMSGGRADSPTVVIVLTDGKPLNTYKTTKAAEEVRKSARLMFIPVTSSAPLSSIKRWASQPTNENVINVEAFSDLSNSSTIDKIIADLCPTVTSR